MPAGHSSQSEPSQERMDSKTDANQSRQDSMIEVHRGEIKACLGAMEACLEQEV
jgi:hypothetical protein